MLVLVPHMGRMYEAWWTRVGQKGSHSHINEHYAICLKIRILFRIDKVRTCG